MTVTPIAEARERLRGVTPAELTITLQITVTGSAVPGVAARVLQEVRELAERVNGTGGSRMGGPVVVGEMVEAPETGPWLRVAPAARTVLLDGEPVQLTRREFDLLLFLCRHRTQVFSREQLLTHVWGYEWTGGARTVDVHIRRLRMKLGSATVSTVHGVGYRIDDRVRVSVENELA